MCNWRAPYTVRGWMSFQEVHWQWIIGVTWKWSTNQMGDSPMIKTDTKPAFYVILNHFWLVPMDLDTIVGIIFGNYYQNGFPIINNLEPATLGVFHVCFTNWNVSCMVYRLFFPKLFTCPCGSLWKGWVRFLNKICLSVFYHETFIQFIIKRTQNCLIKFRSKVKVM